MHAALLMMIARHTGYKPGIFTHFVANEQIYDRHLEAAKEMLSRQGSKKCPKLILNPDKTDFYSFNIEDFNIVDYEPVRPQLELELGI